MYSFLFTQEHLLVLVKNAEQLIYQEKLDKHQDVLNKK